MRMVKKWTTKCLPDALSYAVRSSLASLTLVGDDLTICTIPGVWRRSFVTSWFGVTFGYSLWKSISTWNTKVMISHTRNGITPHWTEYVPNKGHIPKVSEMSIMHFSSVRANLTVANYFQRNQLTTEGPTFAEAKNGNVAMYVLLSLSGWTRNRCLSTAVSSRAALRSLLTIFEV